MDTHNLTRQSGMALAITQGDRAVREWLKAVRGGGRARRRRSGRCGNTAPWTRAAWWRSWCSCRAGQAAEIAASPRACLPHSLPPSLPDSAVRMGTLRFAHPTV
jgi:hypothetical protein